MRNALAFLGFYAEGFQYGQIPLNVMPFGVSMLAPRVVPPLARVLGWPATRFGGAAGRLRGGLLTPRNEPGRPIRATEISNIQQRNVQL